MKILYFSWGEMTKIDCLEKLSQMADITLIEYPSDKMTQADDIIALLQKTYDASPFDYLFSFNFFPWIAQFSYFYKVPYISYVYDSPHHFMYNEWAFNPYSYFFLFDSVQVEVFRQMGLLHVYYLPLPINKERMEALSSTPISYHDDISFMGKLYTDPSEFYTTLKGISPATQTRLDTYMDRQLKEPGVEIIEQALDSKTLDELCNRISIELDSDFHITKEHTIRNSLYRNCTARERTGLVKEIGKHFPISLYTYSNTDVFEEISNITLKGKLDYMTTMPQTFRNSKINLNFTLRTIKSGIPLRCIDVLGAGGFLITNYQKDLEKHFENKKDLVWYHSPDELIELIGYYLTHDEEREEIAANGQKKVLSLFSYEQMLTTIFETVNKNPVVEHTKKEIPISICLIGKNEEKHVDSCLKPWFDLGFEIIVADTGSTDRTMDLARKYTNNVFYHPWANHFAEARNHATKWARNPYILAIDFDEYLIDIHLEELLKVCNSTGIGMLSRRNPNPNGMGDQIMIEQVARLFDKDVCHYKGRIHEQVFHKDGSVCNYYPIPVTLNHQGYAVTEDTQEKALRNLKLLLVDLAECGEDPYTYFQIGQSYRILNDLDHALEYYDMALSMEVEPELEYVQTLVEAYGYCLLEKGDIEAALQLENIYAEFSKRADFVFLMGLIYMNATLFDKAIEQFEKATTIKNCATIGTNSFLAWYNAGVICEVCGLTAESMECYQKCGDYEPALERLKKGTTL